MKFQIHTASGHDGTAAPVPLDAHEAAQEFAAELAELFEVEPARVVYDEWRTLPYTWINVTVMLPKVGTAVFSVDSRKSGADAVRLYLNDRLVSTPEGPAPQGDEGGEDVRGCSCGMEDYGVCGHDGYGRTLARAVADHQARQD
ncbi:TroA family protein [Streptomyces omiyaensis]|uniref:hypothetical protein n=1 Tax=Streptomyces omiyaensis TaxID=68247 RepID=UPI0036F60C27